MRPSVFKPLFAIVLGAGPMAGVVVRDILVPWRDPVRADGVTDDPMEPTAASGAS